MSSGLYVHMYVNTEVWFTVAVPYWAEGYLLGIWTEGQRPHPGTCNELPNHATSG